MILASLSRCHYNRHMEDEKRKDYHVSDARKMDVSINIISCGFSILSILSYKYAPRGQH